MKVLRFLFLWPRVSFEAFCFRPSYADLSYRGAWARGNPKNAFKFGCVSGARLTGGGIVRGVVAAIKGWRGPTGGRENFDAADAGLGMAMMHVLGTVIRGPAGVVRCSDKFPPLNVIEHRVFNIQAFS